jgi:hypothetical protein
MIIWFSFQSLVLALRLRYRARQNIVQLLDSAAGVA